MVDRPHRYPRRGHGPHRSWQREFLGAKLVDLVDTKLPNAKMPWSQEDRRTVGVAFRSVLTDRGWIDGLRSQARALLATDDALDTIAESVGLELAEVEDLYSEFLSNRSVVTVEVRPPRADDAPILTDIHLLAWEETFAGVFPESAWGAEAREHRLAMWTALCTDLRPDGRLVVAEVDGKAVGFALTGLSSEPDAPAARQLPFIYILRSAQGLGVGQALLEGVLTEEPVYLWHLERNPNPRTIAFYRKNGFRPDGGRRPAEYAGAGDVIRLVRQVIAEP